MLSEAHRGMSFETLDLSDDAKVVAGGLFGNMVPGRGEVTFAMVESRPTARCKAALDELVVAGVIACGPLNKHGGLRYVPLMNCHDYFVWMMKESRRRKGRKDLAIQIAEPIDAGRAALKERSDG